MFTHLRQLLHATKALACTFTVLMTGIDRYAMFTCTYFTYEDALLGLRLCGGAGSDSENEPYITEFFKPRSRAGRL